MAALVSTLLAGIGFDTILLRLGLVIFAIGLWLGNLAGKAIETGAMANARLLATVARVAIWVLAGTMALNQMGLGSEIVNLAFGLTLGGVAIAVALAFGLGGRELAGRELEKWRKSLESDEY